VYFIAVINQPYIGLNIKNINEQWIVTSSDPQGEGYKSGVRVGDSILRINNNDIDKYRIVRIWGQIEGVSTIIFRKYGQPNDKMINVAKRPILQMGLREGPLLILALAYWLLGFMTWFRRPFLLQSRILFWLNIFLGTAIALAPASSRGLLLARELEYIIFSAVPILLINFFAVFPRKNVNRVNQWGHLTLSFLFILILIITVLQSAGIVHFISPLRKLVLTTMCIGILLSMWNLGASLKLPKDKPEKNQVIILLLSLVLGLLPFVILTAIPIIFGFKPILDAHVSSLFVSIIPATWYYVIVNKYLPDSRRFLGVAISFFVTGLIVSFIVSYVVCTLNVVKTLNLGVYLTLLSLSMLIVACCSFIRVLFNKLLEELIFFEGKQEFKNKILRLNGILASINEADQIIKELVESLKIEGAFIILEDGNKESIKKAEGIFLKDPSLQVELEEVFHTYQRNNLEAQILEDSPAEIYIPIVSTDFKCGIFLGHSNSHVKLKLDELPLITLLSSQMAQHLITKYVVKDLSKEIKDLAQKSFNSQQRNQGLQGITASLFKSFEKERKSIAHEIHDGPLQLSLDLNRWLKYLTEACPCKDSDKTIEAISHMRELVENLSFELRLICNDLRPPSLSDLGLLSAVELLCEEIMREEFLLISIEADGVNREERFREEVELVAYRFLQEGITNAVKHSGSDKLKINVGMNGSKIELSVKDFGRGFDTSQIDDWLLMGTHFGLAGMKERLESLGGDLQISSIIGQGTLLKATIPIS